MSENSASDRKPHNFAVQGFSPFLANRVVKALGDQFTMPDRGNREFHTKSDQMRYWLTDPILRSEATQWFENAGYYPVLDESGHAYDYTLNPDTEQVAESRRARHAC